MTPRHIIRSRWVQLAVDTLDGNHHGPDHTTLRSTWQVVRMDAYVKSWTLYIYRADGSTINIRVTLPRWRCDWPTSAGSEPHHD